jgi:hypothetical protein
MSMPLTKSTLAQDLEGIFNAKPASAADAATKWANAYQSYASAALSSASSLPITAPANFGILLGAFTAGLSALTSVTAAALISQGILAYWQAMAWVGPASAGSTAFPGNASLSGALSATFADLSDKSAADKANEIAQAFDAGAKTVIVSEVPFAPGPPIVGPIM